MSLYKTTDDILKLEYILRQIEEKGEDYEGASGDISQFLIAPKEEQLAEKVDVYVTYYRDLQATAKAQKEEAKHLRARAKGNENIAGRLKDAAQWASEQLGRKKLQGNTRTITVSTSKRPAIDVIDKWAVPSEFSEPIPDVKIDKKAIVEHLMETGEIVSGVEARKVTKVMFR